MTASNNILCKLLVLWLAVKRELVRWLSVGHLVDLEPFHRGLAGLESIQGLFKNSSYFEEAWHDLVDVLDVVQVLSKRVVDVDRHHLDGVCIEIDIDVHLKLHLPVSLTLIDHRKHSKDLDLEDGASEEKIN